MPSVIFLRSQARMYCVCSRIHCPSGRLWDPLICTTALCHAGAVQGRWWGARKWTS